MTKPLLAVVDLVTSVGGVQTVMSTLLPRCVRRSAAGACS